MSILKVDNLTKYYKKIYKGIENVTFSVEKGEVYGFIGPNGSGKSTTIRTLLNYIFPTSGKAFLLDKDIVSDTIEIRKEVGYLPSEVIYYDDMKVIDVIKYSASFYEGNFDSKIVELSNFLELDLNKNVDDLSFGNRKKVGIICALLHSPKFLILDEPTSGLDPLMQNKFFELLEKEKAKGTTIFFSSHILSEIKRICDKVAIIKNGEIVKISLVSEITKTNYVEVQLKSFELDKLVFPFDILIKKKKKNEIVFIYKGDINLLISLISKIKIEEINILEPRLEEIFMKYYEE